MRVFKELARDLYLPKPPVWGIYIIIILVVLSWIPLALVARARVTRSEARPIQFFQGMFNQPKFTTQKVNPIFADRRAMRPPVPGTVARGTLLDDHFALGYYTDENGAPVTYEEEVAGTKQTLTKYYEGYPDEVTIDEGFLLRGQVKYNAYCFPCHGMDGQGNGPVSLKAAELQALGTTSTNWVVASNLVQVDPAGGLTYGQDKYPDGKMFNVISNGIRNMSGYKTQITPEDRWAIVAYVRALQLAQYAPLEDVPADKRGALK